MGGEPAAWRGGGVLAGAGPGGGTSEPPGGAGCSLSGLFLPVPTQRTNPNLYLNRTLLQSKFYPYCHQKTDVKVIKTGAGRLFFVSSF